MKIEIDSTKGVVSFIDPSDFPDTKGIRTNLGAIQSLAEDISTLLSITGKLVKTEQTKCQHVWQNQFIHWPSYQCGGKITGETILESRFCPKCKLRQTKPPGLPSEICHKCWKPMRPHGMIPGNEKMLGLHIFICTDTNCDHRVFTA